MYGIDSIPWASSIPIQRSTYGSPVYRQFRRIGRASRLIFSFQWRCNPALVIIDDVVAHQFLISMGWIGAPLPEPG
jgi:hypothetical protein